MRVLVTGFPPFAGRPVNPSQSLIDALNSEALPADYELIARLLPVEYVAVEQEFDRLLDELRPDVILAFGVGRQTVSFQLEACGVNCDDAEVPDNAGVLRTSVCISESAPQELTSDLPLEELANELCSAGFDATVSRSAGAFVCNHLLFYALGRIRERSPRPLFAFTHLCAAELGMTTEKSLAALQIMIRWTQNLSRSKTTILASSLAPPRNSERA